MGTRGLLGHIIRGKKLSSYTQYDSYPSELGRKLAKFIRGLSGEQMKQMIENLEQVECRVDQEKDVPHIDFQAIYLDAGFANLTVCGQSTADWACLLYNVQGASALPQILDRKLKHLIDSTDFEHDWIQCEWFYIVDWDKKEVTVGGMYIEKETVKSDELSEDWMLELQERH